MVLSQVATWRLYRGSIIQEEL